MNKMTQHGQSSEVVKITPADLNGLQMLLEKDRLHNIHQLFDIERNGLAEDQNKFWGIFEGDQLHSVFYSEHFYPGGYGLLASEQPDNALPLLDFAFRNDLNSVIWSTPCPQRIVDLYQSKLATVHRWRFYKCGPNHLNPSYQYPCRRATPDDIDELAELYADYEFGAHGGSTDKLRSHIKQNIKNGGTYFCIELDSKIVISAMVYCETSYGGIIGSARTLPEYRRRGLYKSLRTACFEYLFEKNKIGVAFFVESNFKIQKLIEKQGGEFLEDWIVFKNRSEKPRSINSIYEKLRKVGNRIKRLREK
jgi:predicted GNAT family acetyltransferase